MAQYVIRELLTVSRFLSALSQEYISTGIMQDYGLNPFRSKVMAK